MSNRRIGRAKEVIKGVDLTALGLTVLVGTIGGVLGHLAQLPLGYLLGSLLAAGGLAAFQIAPFGRPITFPVRLRMAFVPIIGVAIGGAFTPEVARAALGWAPSLLALCLFVPMAHALGYRIYRAGGLGPVDAYFGSVPGGLLETVQLGEEAGADPRLLTVLQFLRLILTILCVPLIFWALTGHAVGSAAGTPMQGAAAPLTLWEGGLMIAAGLVGALAGKALRLPGYIITGPILISAGLHLGGALQGIPPDWLISLTQVVLGTGLGARFAGITPAMLRRGIGLATINGAASLALAFAFAGALHWSVGEPKTAAFLAFAPGGLAEMSLIALSLQMSVIYVTVHHVARIFLAVGLAALGHRWFIARKD